VSERTTIAIVVIASVAILSSAMVAGCYLVNVAPLRSGRCVVWRRNLGIQGGSWVPCDHAGDAKKSAGS
jgi:hypothetical protein